MRKVTSLLKLMVAEKKNQHDWHEGFFAGNGLFDSEVEKSYPIYSKIQKRQYHIINESSVPA